MLTGTLWSECENGHVWNEDGEMATAQHNVFGENVPERVALDGGDA